MSGLILFWQEISSLGIFVKIALILLAFIGVVSEFSSSRSSRFSASFLHVYCLPVLSTTMVVGVLSVGLWVGAYISHYGVALMATKEIMFAMTVFFVIATIAIVSLSGWLFLSSKVRHYIRCEMNNIDRLAKDNAKRRY